MSEKRLIDANALIKGLEDDGLGDHSLIESVLAAGVYAKIENAPTIDAVPVVHGRWVHEQRYGDSGGWVWRCSVCRREAISHIISALKYCHSCGAKMDGGAE